MDKTLLSDLLSAQADDLMAGGRDYYERYAPLFPVEMEQLQPLFGLAEQIYTLFQGPSLIAPEFRAALKVDLQAQVRQDGFHARRERWRWAAIGASFTVASVIVAAAWRDHQQRAHR
jgi:hypothetical protein